jgi:hypothetical protein
MSFSLITTNTADTAYAGDWNASGQPEGDSKAAKLKRYSHT